VRWCRGSPIRPLAWPHPLSRVFNFMLFAKYENSKYGKLTKICQNPVLRDRISFNADPDSVVLVNVDPDPDPGF
jgi:hypothetical protein